MRSLQDNSRPMRISRSRIRSAGRFRIPGDAIIGEEQGGSLGRDVTGWAIDPIDGTSNFALGLPLWGISIGYLENGYPRLGAIALPELGLTLSAASGSGMRLNGAPVRRA